MAVGRRKAKQQDLFFTADQLPKSPGHPFYSKLNELLADAGFDCWIEELCKPYFKTGGRPSIPPGVYFRMIFVGHFEGIGSQRGIAWRCSDSRSLAEFLGFLPNEATPDHSSLTNMHKRLPMEIHDQVFQFVLNIAAAKELLAGKTVGVDSTTLEASAAMKNIVRKDSGESYKEFLKRLAEEEGLENPTDEELRRFDKTRKDKTCSNAEWESPVDADARVAKMKDGTTHFAYKAENVVDLESEIIVAAVVLHANLGDAATLTESVSKARSNVEEALGEDVLREAAADKGYHSAESLHELQETGVKTYVAVPELRGKRRWTDKPEGRKEAVYGNRRRARDERGRRLQRRRSEVVERSFAHLCETGGARRCWLRGLLKVSKRYSIQAAARNLATIMRLLFGIGTARSLQGTGGARPQWVFWQFWRVRMSWAWWRELSARELRRLASISQFHLYGRLAA